jgi:hypothetical protein
MSQCHMHPIDIIGIPFFCMDEKPKKDRDDRYGRGETQKAIIRYLCNFDKGVGEPDLRQFLKEELDLNAPKNIKLHLEKLENAGLIKKVMQKGRPNIWSVNFDNEIDVSLYLVNKFFLDRSFSNSQEGQERVLELFHLNGTQKLISKISHLDRLSLWLFIDILEILPEKSEYTHLKYSLQINDAGISNLLKISEKAALLSPTFFCSLILPMPEVRSMFWLNFDEIFLKKYPGKKILPILYLHYIMSAMWVDNQKIVGFGEQISEILGVCDDSIQMEYLEDFLSRIEKIDAMKEKVRIIIKTDFDMKYVVEK